MTSGRRVPRLWEERKVLGDSLLVVQERVYLVHSTLGFFNIPKLSLLLRVDEVRDNREISYRFD